MSTPQEFGARLKQSRKAAKLTQQDAAKRAGVSQSVISELERGMYSSSTNTVRLAAAYRVNAHWLETGRGSPEAAAGSLPAESPPQSTWPFPGIAEERIRALDQNDIRRLEGAIALALAQMGMDATVFLTKETKVEVKTEADPTPQSANDEYVEVPQMDVKLAAGFGILNFEEPVRGGLMFRRSFLRGEGINPARARVVYVHGHSMEPELPHGAALLVDVCDLSLPDLRMDFVYALQIQGEECVKAITRDDEGRLVARSYNPEFEDIVLEGRSDFRVIGPAGWKGSRIKPKGDEIRARHAAWRSRRSS